MMDTRRSFRLRFEASIGRKFLLEHALISKPVPLTLAEADMSSQHSVSRRSLLGTIGVGLAAAVICGALTPARAAVVDRLTGDIVGSPGVKGKKKKGLKSNAPPHGGNIRPMGQPVPPRTGGGFRRR